MDTFPAMGASSTERDTGGVIRSSLLNVSICTLLIVLTWRGWGIYDDVMNFLLLFLAIDCGGWGAAVVVAVFEGVCVCGA
jgi:hypothetical protein